MIPEYEVRFTIKFPCCNKITHFRSKPVGKSLLLHPATTRSFGTLLIKMSSKMRCLAKPSGVLWKKDSHELQQLPPFLWPCCICSTLLLASSPRLLSKNEYVALVYGLQTRGPQMIIFGPRLRIKMKIFESVGMSLSEPS